MDAETYQKVRVIGFILFFLLVLMGCKEWKSSCFDIVIPGCDYKKTPKKCKELEQKECDRGRIRRMGK